MAIDIRREAEELVRYHSELVRRLGQAGVRDVTELLALYDRLRRALDAVSRQEIGWAAEQVERLVERLTELDRNLGALRRLKAALEAQTGPGPAAEVPRRATY
jgi:hypothetical protein